MILKGNAILEIEKSDRIYFEFYYISVQPRDHHSAKRCEYTRTNLRSELDNYIFIPRFVRDFSFISRKRTKREREREKMCLHLYLCGMRMPSVLISNERRLVFVLLTAKIMRRCAFIQHHPFWKEKKTNNNICIFCVGFELCFLFSSFI